jgi:hypothetical protein
MLLQLPRTESASRPLGRLAWRAQVSILRPGIDIRLRSMFMTVSCVCAIAVRYSQPRYTGKERDSELGNDYFGGTLLR